MARIYVACLASYNNGRLHGAWIDCAGKDADDINAEIATMLRASPYPNVHVSDYEAAARAAGWDNSAHAISNIPNDEGYWMKDGVTEPAGNYRAYIDVKEVFHSESIPPLMVPSAEEWTIHDHESFHGLLSECTDIETVAKLAEFFGDADGDKVAGLLWLIRDRGYTVTDAMEKADDVTVYHGEAKDYAREHFEELYSEALDFLPSILQNAIDWDNVAQELQIGSDIDTFDCPEQGRVIITNASAF